MRQYSKSPQRQRQPNSHRRNGPTVPSIGLPSSYPASPSTMIANGIKSFVEDAYSTRMLSLPADDDSLMMMNLDQNDSMTSFDTSVLQAREGSTEVRQQPQPTPQRPTPSKAHRRQRNRAFSGDDFAAIMHQYTATGI